MTSKKLSKMNRKELLQLMLQQSKRIDELEQQLAEAQAELEDRRIVAAEAGSIATAAIRLNRVFEAAQLAADQYLLSLRAMTGRSEAANE